MENLVPRLGRGILAAAFGHGDRNPPCANNPKKHALDTLKVGYDIGDPELVNFGQATYAIHWLKAWGRIWPSRRWWLHSVKRPGNSYPRAVSAIGGAKRLCQLCSNKRKLEE